MKVRVRTSLITVRYSGNIEKSMVSIITFSVGELNMVARVVSRRAPPSCIPFATGAAQLTQTPSGVPTATPISVFTKPLLCPRAGIIPIRVRRLAPITSPNAIPSRFVSTQLIVV
jgi:hypothetical protein